MTDFLHRLFQRKIWYLTVTTVSSSGSLSQIHYGPDKEWKIVELKNSFHSLAKTQGSGYNVSTIIHTVPRQ
uniref:Uncharacterized protein n=1 Tax=Ochrobactrum phage ORM_20 TaxID=2985243 RepID=A0A9N6WWK2_9VIRU|nr:hypothetical protein ORM20_00034 [Ochrobactrum phage ORM_20]